MNNKNSRNTTKIRFLNPKDIKIDQDGYPYTSSPASSKNVLEGADSSFLSQNISSIHHEDIIAFGINLDDTDFSMSILKDLQEGNDQKQPKEAKMGGQEAVDSRRNKNFKKMKTGGKEGSGKHYKLREGIESVKSRYDRTVSKKRYDSKETVKNSKKLPRKGKQTPIPGGKAKWHRQKASNHSNNCFGGVRQPAGEVERGQGLSRLVSKNSILRKHESSLQQVISRYEKENYGGDRVEMLKNIISPKRDKIDRDHQPSRFDSQAGSSRQEAIAMEFEGFNDLPGAPKNKLVSHLAKKFSCKQLRAMKSQNKLFHEQGSGAYNSSSKKRPKKMLTLGSTSNNNSDKKSAFLESYRPRNTADPVSQKLDFQLDIRKRSNQLGGYDFRGIRAVPFETASTVNNTPKHHQRLGLMRRKPSQSRGEQVSPLRQNLKLRPSDSSKGSIGGPEDAFRFQSSTDGFQYHSSQKSSNDLLLGNYSSVNTKNAKNGKNFKKGATLGCGGHSSQMSSTTTGFGFNNKRRRPPPGVMGFKKSGNYSSLKTFIVDKKALKTGPGATKQPVKPKHLNLMQNSARQISNMSNMYKRDAKMGAKQSRKAQSRPQSVKNKPEQEDVVDERKLKVITLKKSHSKQVVCGRGKRRVNKWAGSQQQSNKQLPGGSHRGSKHTSRIGSRETRQVIGKTFSEFLTNTNLKLQKMVEQAEGSLREAGDRTGCN